MFRVDGTADGPLSPLTTTFCFNSAIPLDMFLFLSRNVNETGWSVCRSLLGCCAPAVCRSGFARWCSCVLLFSGACGLMVVLRLGLLLLYSCLWPLLCFLPPLSCLRGLWWLVSLQGSPGSCHVMLCCTYIPSPCFRGLGVCVWAVSKVVKLVPQ